MLDYHVHALAHGEYTYTDSWLEQFARKARERGIKELGFSEHNEFFAGFNPELLQRLQAQFPDLQIKLGLEMDFIPGREEGISRFTQRFAFDYIIGSVHFIGDWAFDHPDYRKPFEEREVDDVYREYFSLVERAAVSGLFDIIGHLDLVKIWGHRPVKMNSLAYAKQAFPALRASGLVVEINSAGLRKPVGEIYPSAEIATALYENNIPVTLGSDAHHPDQVGEGLKEAIELARQAGYRRVISFKQRQAIPVHLE